MSESSPPSGRASSGNESRFLAQVGALPVKIGPDGLPLVLLLTSRETKRWVIPKGWPMKGRKPHEAAAREAEEEAGVIGRPNKAPVGSYTYLKRREHQVDRCEVTVFLLPVEKERAKWLEKGQRERRWCTLAEAAGLVEEPGLAALLLKLAGWATASGPAKFVGKPTKPDAI